MKRPVFLLILVLLFPPAAELFAAPRFIKSECPFPDPDKRLEGVECGYVSVPENRANPNSRTLRLAVVILRSLSLTPEPDPLVFLTGGPGQRSIHHTERRTHSDFWKPFREKRDLVFFDQRGTGYSDPKFCKDLYSAFTASFRGLSPQELREFQVQSFQDCKRRMQEQGIDFSAYNSRTSAEDLEDIRVALGFDRWNVFGVSYGTRLALTAMRDTPGGIRSVILDSLDPPNARILVDAPARLDRSLNLLFEQCETDKECAQKYPDLRAQFYGLIKNLEANPMVVSGLDPNRFKGGQLILDGTMLVEGVFRGFYDYRFIPLMPAFIAEIKKRNVDLLRAVADALVPEPEEISIGLQYSVDCYELAPFNPRSEISAQQARFPHIKEWNQIVNDHVICDVWHDERAGAKEGEAVHSQVPTLLLSGEFDPITPPSYGRLAATTLTNSTFVEIPGAGHAASSSSDCTRSLLSSFLNNPGKKLDTSCVQNLQTKLAFRTDLRNTAGVYKMLSNLQPTPQIPFMIGVGMIVLILGSTIFWPIGYLLGRRSASPSILQKARWLAGFSALLALGFLTGIAMVVFKLAAINPYVLAFGLPGKHAWLLLLPWIELLLSMLLVGLAVIAWKQKWWSSAGRIHYSLVALASAAFCGVMIWLKLLAL
jgi:pimeloyl-ACP methyl ester carboxylesterase